MALASTRCVSPSAAPTLWIPVSERVTQFDDARRLVLHKVVHASMIACAQACSVARVAESYRWFIWCLMFEVGYLLFVSL